MNERDYDRRPPNKSPHGASRSKDEVRQDGDLGYLPNKSPPGASKWQDEFRRDGNSGYDKRSPNKSPHRSSRREDEFRRDGDLAYDRISPNKGSHGSSRRENEFRRDGNLGNPDISPNKSPPGAGSSRREDKDENEFRRDENLGYDKRSLNKGSHGTSRSRREDEFRRDGNPGYDKSSPNKSPRGTGSSRREDEYRRKRNHDDRERESPNKHASASSTSFEFVLDRRPETNQFHRDRDRDVKPTRDELERYMNNSDNSPSSSSRKRRREENGLDGDNSNSNASFTHSLPNGVVQLNSTPSTSSTTTFSSEFPQPAWKVEAEEPEQEQGPENDIDFNIDIKPTIVQNDDESSTIFHTEIRIRRIEALTDQTEPLAQEQEQEQEEVYHENNSNAEAEGYENEETVNSRFNSAATSADPDHKMESYDEEHEQNDQIASVSNFFDLKVGKFEPMHNNAYVGAPLPKMQKKAVYNSHTQDEEVQYIAENTADKRKVTIPQQNISDDEDEDYSNRRSGYNKIEHKKIYERYNFDAHRVNTNRLAVMNQRQTILDALSKRKVVIIHGFTGCGKTTQIPQFILDNHVRERKSCNIVVTQPRRISAIAMAKRVSFEREWKVGEIVGYQVGMDKEVGPDTLVTYMTTGLLLQKLINRKTLRPWTHIIIDEVHERDIDTDTLLLVIKKILIQYSQDDVESQVKIILMSATLDPVKFAKYFTVINSYEEYTEAPVITIPYNSPYLVTEHFLENIIAQDEADKIYSKLNDELEKPAVLDEILDAATELIASFDKKELAPNDPRAHQKAFKQSKRENRGSVLVFLPGREEIYRMRRKLETEVANQKKNLKNDLMWDILDLHSSVTYEDQQKVFNESQNFRRKIVLSTNLAESSLTVPDIVYVIDFCLTKLDMIDQKTNFNSLRMIWASISQCTQRKGRAGRVSNGDVYRMVTKRFYLKLDKDSQPEMLKCSLENVILNIKALDLGPPKDILSLAVDQPNLSQIERAVANLKELGALTIMTSMGDRQSYSTTNGDRTYLGQIMNVLPIPLNCTRLILLGYALGVMKECIVIAAGLNGKSPFTFPLKKKLDSYMSKLNYSNMTYSDCFALLEAYKLWSTIHSNSKTQDQKRLEEKWAKASFIDIRVLRTVDKMVTDLERRLKDNFHLEDLTCMKEYEEKEDANKGLMIKIAIAGAFYPNYFHHHKKTTDAEIREYERDCSKKVYGNDLISTIYYTGFPDGHDGRIYAKYIIDKTFLKDSIPRVKFEGRNVLVLFDNKGEKIGPICKSIYKCFKQGRLKNDNYINKMEIDVLSKEEEKKYLAANRKFGKGIPTPNQYELPSIGEEKMDIYVVHVVSPGCFWVVDRKRVAKMEEMYNTINAGDKKYINLREKDMFPGELCLARHTDGWLYRARFETSPVFNSVVVQFVDHGNTEKLSLDKIFKFDPSHLKSFAVWPTLAIECRLSEMKPSMLFGSVWQLDAINIFNKFIKNSNSLEIKIYAIANGIIAGNLIGTFIEDGQPKKYSINEKLYKRFAEKCTEISLFEENKTVRARYGLIKKDDRQVKAHNDAQKAKKIVHEIVESPQPGSSDYQVELKGPNSPLEMTFSSLCQSSNAKQVNIDFQSVNSVALDQEPTCHMSRLMVAANIGIQDKGGRIVARETTLMPAIKGLLPLMAMTFCPRIEMRVDSRQVRYTGVLCGLGVDPNEGDPIYPDHDIEVVLDTEIDDEDIYLINQIRYLFNLILKPNAGLNIHPNRKALSDTLIRLLLKPRKKVFEEIWPQESFVWNRIPPTCINLPNAATFPSQRLDIFPPHASVKLNQDVEEEELENSEFLSVVC